MSDEDLTLALNAGSTSLRFALFAGTPSCDRRLALGAVERVGRDGGRLWLRGDDGKLAREHSGSYPDHLAAAAAAFDALDAASREAPRAVGHRILVGAGHHRAPERIDAKLLESIAHLANAPEPRHAPALSCVDAAWRRYPESSQVACFDTAFHGSLPTMARASSSLDSSPITRSLGMHGLSYEYVLETLGKEELGRAIVAHLGATASMVALRNGNLVDTADFPSGAADSSSDMRSVLERRAKDERAGLAFEAFCYRARKAIGGLYTVLGGLDTLVFTGGIGEHAAPVRARICAGLEVLGVYVDRQQNRESNDVISPLDAPCIVRVVPTDEELMIAQHAWRHRFQR
ncbi:MAG TPA: hypothetical protein VJT73_11535 [Polyangiaceae bacterium]|nr:hypothetical protein [Polyangiaceae bacterium]